MPTWEGLFLMKMKTLTQGQSRNSSGGSSGKLDRGEKVSKGLDTTTHHTQVHVTTASMTKTTLYFFRLTASTSPVFGLITAEPTVWI